MPGIAGGGPPGGIAEEVRPGIAEEVRPGIAEGLSGDLGGGFPGVRRLWSSMPHQPRRIATPTPPPVQPSRSTPESEVDDDGAVRALDGVVIRLAGLAPEQRIAAIAVRQRGCVCRRQLIAAGIDRRAVDRRLARGLLIVRHPGVFDVGHRAPAPLRAQTAALLAMRPGAALSHASAAALWGLSVRVDGAIHVTVPGVAGGNPAGVRAHRSTILTPADLRIRAGLPVTDPARTMLDLAPSLTERECERGLDHALRDDADDAARCRRAVEASRRPPRTRAAAGDDR